MRDAAAATDQGSPPASGERVLRVVGARRRFGERSALDGVDLELGRGEIYGLLGPNGAGKTTLVRAISGRLRLDGGRVDVCGLDPAADPDARRQLGLVPQEIALYGDLTAREN
ncbi:MAG: ATP-binding cassette domain-containing protein, partial [Holophagae bacterium]